MSILKNDRDKSTGCSWLVLYKLMSQLSWSSQHNQKNGLVFASVDHHPDHRCSMGWLARINDLLNTMH